jgi:hypothetical protein
VRSTAWRRWLAAAILVMLYGPALVAVSIHDTVAEEPPLAPYAR